MKHLVKFCFAATLVVGGCGDDGGGGDASDASVTVDAAQSIDADTNLCSTAPCVNGGTCVAANTCECAADTGWSGATCDTCADGWEGTACDTITAPLATGMVLWLAADDPSANGTAPANDDLVDVWVDKTGGTPNFIQNTEANQPKIVIEDGKTMVHFDGADDALLSSSAVDVLTDMETYTIVLAVRGQAGGAMMGGIEAGDTGHGLLVETIQPNNVRVLHRMPFGGVNGDKTADQTSTVQEFDYSAWNQVWFTRTPTQSTLCINGANCEVVSGAANDTDNFDNDLDMVLGQIAPDSATRLFQGDIGEIIVYADALAANEVNRNNNSALRDYLVARWGVAN